ncbi:tellurium resistance protein [Malaciobacter mytili LMG 24559]|uniref:Tellurium resistance protein n=1 Tax=Malaciobacter mytili LMG 24559 TaxID=1032238 RepID=A0AAX2ADV0_9BACT|nr:methyltransferase domain-containing protein [Malaciobacter mytili]AXH13793.1 putative tellurite resistance protein TehB [Malaciobacter mytili LMG 24559]RXK12935.1 tellurium resistance protein [Malaciobacter mytili LMG 24559]
MSQQQFWNEKFTKDGYLYGINPNEFLASKLNLFKKDSKLLCLGEGEGRNAIFFAKNGFKVKAIDVSNIGLEKLQKRAKEQNLDINTLCIDLNHWQANEKYDVIIASYLHMYKNEREELFLKIENSLNIKGYFVAEFFSQNQLSYNSGGPKDTELLYTIEDFKNNFNSCTKQISEEIVFLNEGRGHQGKASVIRVVIQKS